MATSGEIIYDNCSLSFNVNSFDIYYPSEPLAPPSYVSEPIEIEMVLHVDTADLSNFLYGKENCKDIVEKEDKIDSRFDILDI